MRCIAALLLVGCAASAPAPDAGSCNRDGTCDPSETCGSCAFDCGPCTGCNDGFCLRSEGETCQTCPLDCGRCDGAMP